MAEKVFVYSDSKAPEFTGRMQEQMDIRRQYVTALRELAARVGTEFPEDTNIQNAVTAAITEHAREVVKLEMMKIQSTLQAALEKVGGK